MEKPHVLILEDESYIRENEIKIAKDAGFDVSGAKSFEEAMEKMQYRNSWEAFIVDLGTSSKNPDYMGRGGIEFLTKALESFPSTPVAIVSQHLDDWALELCSLLLNRLMHIRLVTDKLFGWGERVAKFLADANQNYQSRLKAMQDPAYQAYDFQVAYIISDLVPIIASTLSPILIIGETGTGKEDLARKIHLSEKNPYKDGPFVSINCAAFTDTLVTSELFGHVRGAYTDAKENRLGVFLEASGWKKTKVASDDREKLVEKILSMCGATMTELYTKFTSSRKELRNEIHQLALDIEKIQQYSDGSNLMFEKWIRSMGLKIVPVRRVEDGAAEQNQKNNTFERMGVKYVNCKTTEAHFLLAKDTPGTLFLDEVGNLSHSAQTAILRALDGYGIRPLGYTGPPLLPNLRIIAATNRIQSLEDIRGNQPTFRPDLFWRLAGWVIELPPLRDRKTDDGTLEGIKWLEKQAMRDGIQFENGCLEEYANTISSSTRDKELPLWSGNWRELRHFYTRVKASAKIRGSQVICQSDLQFANEWALRVSSKDLLQDETETPNGKAGQFPLDSPNLAEKLNVKKYLDKYELAYAQAKEKINDDKQTIHLEDIGQACNPPVSHVPISNFFNPKKPNPTKGAELIKLIKELANEFPDQWPLLRTLDQWPS